jgi:dihydrolipoamide dehydrogenase
MYDLVIIGAGWAGINAALKAKGLNLKVALADKSLLGGTCLNLGCIPTKFLIHSAKILSLVSKSADFGIENTSPLINFLKVQQKKDKIVNDLRLGIQFTLKGVDLFSSEVKVITPNEVDVGGKIIKAKFILVASGSRPLELSQLKFDGKRVISSEEALSLEKLPSSLLIIGGGVIGCEFASLFSNLGVKVTILEKMAQLLPGEDKETVKKLSNIFSKKGIKVNTQTDISNFDFNSYDLILVCIGREMSPLPYGLKELGVKTNTGIIEVDDYLKTSVDNIYAAGDCASRIMLAHFASYQGRLAVENMFSAVSLRKKNYSFCMPCCIFTDPEVASVGLNEDDAVKSGIPININKFDLLGSGMARIINESSGFIKIVTNRETGLILGGSIIGPHATEIIGILTLAVSCRLNIEQLRNTIFAHPTLSESIGEAVRS